MSKQLYRSESDRMIGGVCGGIAEYFGIDPTLIRIAFILIIMLGGSGLLIYVVLWVVLPLQNDQNEGEKMDKKSTQKDEIITQEKSGKHIWGFFLIGLGIVMLLQNFGVAEMLYLHKTWPAILVVLGLLVLSK